MQLFLHFFGFFVIHGKALFKKVECLAHQFCFELIILWLCNLLLARWLDLILAASWLDLILALILRSEHICHRLRCLLCGCRLSIFLSCKNVCSSILTFLFLSENVAWLLDFFWLLLLILSWRLIFDLRGILVGWFLPKNYWCRRDRLLAEIDLIFYVRLCPKNWWLLIFGSLYVKFWRFGSFKAEWLD